MIGNLKIGYFLQGSNYRIEATLGQGSFGITYLALHTVLNKKVAIKEFFMKEVNGRSEDGSITGMSDGSLSMDYARKFQKEAKNLATLEHPNIVKVTDSFSENGTYYYVMDYIEGENLKDYVTHGNVSAEEAVSIIRDVAEALEYMHNQKHMLHLDLKPGNVMRRSSDGHIFLIDFGLSKHYSSSGQPETSTTIGLGTPGYAPIEQANQAKSGEFRPTIDVYALGATFFKLLTGETPPAASELVSDDELLVERLTLHHVDDALSEVVVNAMQPNIKKRTQSVRNFLTTLYANVVSLSVDSHGNEETQIFNDSFSNLEETYSFGVYPERYFLGTWKSTRKQVFDDCVMCWSWIIDYKARQQSTSEGTITVTYEDETCDGEVFDVEVSVRFNDMGHWHLKDEKIVECSLSIGFYNLQVRTSVELESDSLADLKNQWADQLEKIKAEMMQETQTDIIIISPNFIRMKSDGSDFLLERIK